MCRIDALAPSIGAKPRAIQAYAESAEEHFPRRHLADQAVPAHTHVGLVRELLPMRVHGASLQAPYLRRAR